MLYLLTLGWPWFVGAVALGLVVGIATAPQKEGAIPNKGFALLGATILILPAAALFTGKFHGREALTLEVALLASSAYFVGVLAGGAITNATSAPSLGRAKPRYSAAPTFQLRGGGVARGPEAVEAPGERPKLAPPSGMASAEAPSGEKGLPGKRPEALTVPRAGGADDLKRIKGIGPKSEEKLNALGVYHFDQIAGWDLDNARWMGAALAIPGRIERGKWIQQARELAAQQRGRTS